MAGQDREPGLFTAARRRTARPATRNSSRRRSDSGSSTAPPGSPRSGTPLPGLCQLAQRLRQRGLRLGQLHAQRRNKRGHHLISGTSIITSHTRTLLPPRIIHPTIRHHRGSGSAPTNGATLKWT
jgi:hypothetical protein